MFFANFDAFLRPFTQLAGGLERLINGLICLLFPSAKKYSAKLGTSLKNFTVGSRKSQRSMQEIATIYAFTLFTLGGQL